MDDFEKYLKNQPLRATPPEWRAEILAKVKPQARASTASRGWLHVWLWPSPYAWGALAAAWMVIFILNSAAQPGRNLTPQNGPTPTLNEMVAMINEHRREVDEFMPREKVVMTAPSPTEHPVSPGACLTPRRSEQSQYA